jgi:hypothetical protein
MSFSITSTHVAAPSVVLNRPLVWSSPNPEQALLPAAANRTSGSAGLIRRLPT